MRYQKGHIGYWRGKISPNRKGEDRNCLLCGKVFYAPQWAIKRGEGKYCSRSCSLSAPVTEAHRKHLSESHKGSRCATWRGGVTKQYAKRFANYKWKALKSEIYKRDNYTCQSCLKRLPSRQLGCHHLIPYRYCNGNEEAFLYWNITVNSPANLVTLCLSCHAKEDWKYRKNEERGIYGLQTILHKVSAV